MDGCSLNVWLNCDWLEWGRGWGWLAGMFSHSAYLVCWRIWHSHTLLMSSRNGRKQETDIRNGKQQQTKSFRSFPFLRPKFFCNGWMACGGPTRRPMYVHMWLLLLPPTTPNLPFFVVFVVAATVYSRLGAATVRPAQNLHQSTCISNHDFRPSSSVDSFLFCQMPALVGQMQFN